MVAAFGVVVALLRHDRRLMASIFPLGIMELLEYYWRYVTVLIATLVGIRIVCSVSIWWDQWASPSKD